MQGQVEIRRDAKLEWYPATLNQKVCTRDTVRTSARSRATLVVQGETFIILDERSTARFSNIRKDEGILPKLLNLFSGQAYFRSRRPRELEVETPFVNAMHQGTEFLVSVSDNSTQIIVFDGSVLASNDLGKLLIHHGESALTRINEAPVIGPRIALRDAVQWTLYYPPVINHASLANSPSYGNLLPTLNHFDNNDLTGAFEQLDQLTETQQSAEYHILYASLLLIVGRVEQANQHLQIASKLNGEAGAILALRSIIQLARSDKEGALGLALQAQAAAPEAAAPQIALSYAYQAQFNIDKALESALSAVKADPNNALAWARVSELQLAHGDVDASVEAAQKAKQLNPNLAKTNTVLGFTRLATLDLNDAELSFRTAIQQDPSDPLAYLGLGLAKIRQGHIKSGTRDMETAANLDPDNSLIRSYLGKAYYEQRRGDIASTEYAIAKELDPNDPTPWFYDAIYKQTVNRPIEALHDMQKAIELNDNRAVFRSKLLLDDDLASRSAALGRIYNDLGFQQRGLLEGWKAVNNDPTNYSAHRLLADNYAALPRHEIARVSELLQSQLLQPINITPVQPQLAESNLLILNGLGPSESSFKEFNPLFARNRAAVQASGIVGSNNTYADEITHSALWNNLSYSIGQFHYQSDGHRKNNDTNQNIYNLFVQSSVSHNLNLQGEIRYKKQDHGDLSIDTNNPFITFRKKLKSKIARIGARYSFTPHSKIIASTIYESSKQTTFDGPVINNTNNKGHRSEIQHLFNSQLLNIITGGGYAKSKQDTFTKTPRFSTASDSKTRHSNAYVYSYLTYPNNLKWTFGVSFDSLDNTATNKFNHINPKIGATWNLSSNTIIRASYFKHFKGLKVTDQTLEPTQVAGFNQFYDDATGTESRRFGIALDHRFTDSLFTGLEASKRNLVVTTQGEMQNWSETLYKTYINWAPNNRIALKLIYSHEDFNIVSAKNPTGTPDTKTHLVPITISYFDPSGFFTSFGVNYVNQRLKNSSTNNKHNQFISVNTSVGYRFPKRYGLIQLKTRNLLNEQIIYHLNQRTNSDEQNPQFSLGRSIIGEIRISF